MAKRVGTNSEGADAHSAREPFGGGAIDRRGFLSAATLALLGVAASSVIGPELLFADALDPAGNPAVWPLSKLSTVSVAANAAAKRYPRLVPGAAFNNHPAVVLLERSLAGLSGRTALAAIQAAVPVGGNVLIKPNWVEPSLWSSGKITHPSLVLAVARLAAEAVGPTGTVRIGEGTAVGKDLPHILSKTGFPKALKAFGLDEKTATRARVQVIDLNSSSAGSVKVKLGSKSRFNAVRDTLYDSGGRSMGKMGGSRIGAYRIAKPIIDADLVIDFAKAKVHCSAGVTLSLKNFVGIVPTGAVSNKTVPHYSAADKRTGHTYVRNSTIGRTAADLHASALYAASSGALKTTPQRKFLCIIDGVVCGETNQFSPHAKATGWIAASYDPVALDHVASRCMGFDPARIVSLKPSRTVTLKLGNGVPHDVRVAYRGAGSFTGYFSAKRALKPESVVAKWGTTMALNTRVIKTPTVTLTGSHLVIKPSGTGLVVRVYSATEYAHPPRAANGTYSLDIPAEMTGPIRVAVMDAHFNVWDRQVRA